MKTIHNGRHRHRCLSPYYGCKEAKTVSTFEYPHHTVVLHTFHPPRGPSKLWVLSRWLFPALMERLFSAHKMKWISVPEPESSNQPATTVPSFSPPFPLSLFVFVLFFFFVRASLILTLSSSLSLDFESHVTVAIVSHEFLWRVWRASLFELIRITRGPSPTVRWTTAICQECWIETVVTARSFHLLLSAKGRE